MKISNSERFLFTYDNIESCFQLALQNGYKVIRCIDFAQRKEFYSDSKILINRVDIDFSIKKAKTLVSIFNDLNIKATFFIRLHAKEYNPFDYENYRVLKLLRDNDFEIGYHSEIVDISSIWNEDAEDCLHRDLDVLNRMLDITIKGIASHGGMTGLNNLDFWKDHKPEDFGLLYEAYDWFDDVFYISDSEWTKWKCYEKGKLVEGDLRSLGEHVMDNHPVIYSLIHSDTFYYDHFYE